jgi:hypothetical protein
MSADNALSADSRSGRDWNTGAWPESPSGGVGHARGNISISSFADEA